MRLANRKPGKYTFKKIDPRITQEKFDELTDKLHHMKTVSRPRLARDVKEYAANGDFSENAEYQIAKGRLRGLNRGIDEIGEQLSKAEIIKPASDTSQIQIGHTITVLVKEKQVCFQILGSAEANPKDGVISYQSPLGKALLGNKIGDKVEIEVGVGVVEYKVLDIK